MPGTQARALGGDQKACIFAAGRAKVKGEKSMDEEQKLPEDILRKIEAKGELLDLEAPEWYYLAEEEE